MLDGDLRLEKVWTGSGAEVLEGVLGCGENPNALIDRIGVSERAVLVVEQQQVSGGVEAGGRARMLEQLEGEQGQHLGALRHEGRDEGG